MYHFILAVTDTQRMMTISSLNQILAANMLLSNFQAKRVNLIPKSYIFYNIAAMLRCGKLTLSRVQLSIVGNFNYTWPCLPVVLLYYDFMEENIIQWFQRLVDIFSRICFLFKSWIFKNLWHYRLKIDKNSRQKWHLIENIIWIFTPKLYIFQKRN